MNPLAQVRTFVVERFLFGDGARLHDDTSFMQAGILDSTGILELVTFLERTFGIALADEDLVPENLDSLCGIARFLEARAKGTPGQRAGP